MASIFFNPKIYLNKTRLDKINDQTKTYERIGAIWNALKASPNSQETTKLLEKLGVAKTDDLARKQLIPIIQSALHDEVTINPSESDSGVFFLSVYGKIIAVFKVGEKRARMELLTRKIAHQIGLEKHAIPGVVCSIAYPRFPNEEIQVELWNGNVKLFRGVNGGNYNDEVINNNCELDHPFTVTGILEPYLDSNNQITPEELLHLTVYSLFIGLRDGKLNGLSGATLFDAEDCMPERFIPDTNPNQKVAATHLPFLEHEFAKKEISVDVLRKLHAKVKNIYDNIFSFLANLAQEQVEFVDLASESLPPAKVDPETGEELIEGENTGWDDGGCPEAVIEPTFIMEKHPSIEVETPHQRILTNGQLEACQARITRLYNALKSQIEMNKPISTIDFVCKVDPFYKAQMDALKRNRFDDRVSPETIIGHHHSGQVKALLLDETQTKDLLDEQARSSPVQMTNRIIDISPQIDIPSRARIISEEDLLAFLGDRKDHDCDESDATH